MRKSGWVARRETERAQKLGAFAEEEKVSDSGSGSRYACSVCLHISTIKEDYQGMYITHYTGLVVIALQDCILPFYTMHCTIGRILFITRSTALHSAIVVVAIIQSDKAVYLYLTVI